MNTTLVITRNNQHANRCMFEDLDSIVHAPGLNVLKYGNKPRYNIIYKRGDKAFNNLYVPAGDLEIGNVDPILGMRLTLVVYRSSDQLLSDEAREIIESRIIR